jgi:RHS repeat-associated protein
MQFRIWSHRMPLVARTVRIFAAILLAASSLAPGKALAYGDQGQAYGDCVWMAESSGFNVVEPCHDTVATSWPWVSYWTFGYIDGVGHQWSFAYSGACADKPDLTQDASLGSDPVCSNGCAYQASSSTGGLINFAPTGGVCLANPPPTNPQGVSQDRNLGEPDCPTGACPVGAGNPINTATGNKYQRETDFIASDLLRFERFYNSAATAPSHLVGRHWTNTYTRRVTALDANTVVVGRPDGRSSTFTLSAGVWLAQAGDTSTLDRQVDGSGNPTGWTYRALDARESESFDALGRLTSVSRMSGESIALVYNYGVIENGPKDYSPTTVTDQSGRTLSFDYDPSNRLVKLTDPTGAQYAYTYDGLGRLKAVTFQDATSIRYLYNEPTHTAATDLPEALTGIVDEKGQRFATFKYRTDGKAISTEHAGGVEKVSISYGVSTTVTLPSGLVQQRSFTSPVGVNQISAISETANGVTRTRSFTFDANGKTDIVTDALGTTEDFDFNSRGLVTQHVESANVAATKRTTQTDWHASLNVPTENRLLNAAGALEAKSTLTYNARGQVASASLVHLTNSALTRTTTMTYCEQAGVNAGTCPVVGLLLSVDGPRTDVADTTSYVYRQSDEATCASSPNTCPYRKGDLWKITNAMGQVIETLKYDGARRPLSFKGENGVVTDLEYNTRGWLTARKVRGSDNNTETDDAITRLDYESTGVVSRVTQADASFLIFGYDLAHRLTDVTDTQGNSVHFTLNNAGERIQEQTKNSGFVVKRTLSRVFNTFGQLQTLADALSTPTDFTYDLKGALNTTTDPLLRVIDQDVDALGRVRQVIANTGGGVSDRSTMQFVYDARDQLRAVVDPKGLSTNYTIDSVGNLTDLSSPDTGSTIFSYDLAGNRTAEMKADNVTQGYVYDALNRLVTRTFAHSAQNMQYVYDVTQTECAAGENFSSGRLTKLLDGSGSTRFCYDSRGNTVRQVQTVTGGAALTLGMSYNAADQIRAMTYPSKAVVTYLRDTNGRIIRVDVKPTETAAQVTVVSNATYLPFGPLNTLTFGNSRVLTKTYDQNYNIDSVVDSATNNPLSEDFTVNAVGIVTGLTERTGASSTVSRTFAYDGLDRLVAQKNGTSTVEGFSYNGTGDRLSKSAASTANYSYPAGSHRLSAVGNTARTYNATGETLTIGSGGSSKVFTYDDDHRMSTMKVNNSLKFSNSLNGFGQRVAKRNSSGAVATQFVYDQGGHLLGEYTALGTRLKEYVWLDGTLVAILSDFDASTYQYVETDHLGTPRAIVQPTKNLIVWRWDINNTAFGEHLPNENPDGDKLSYSLNLRYPGQYFDAESSTSYNYFREYDPASGRYLQSDPIGLAGDISTYSYVGGRSLNSYDSLGLWSWGDSLPAWIVDGGIGFGSGVISGISFGLSDGGILGIDTGNADECSSTFAYARTAGMVEGGFAVGGAVLSGLKALRSARSVEAVALPSELTVGNNARTGVDVYLAARNGQAVYCGITCNIAQRASQHGSRFDLLEQITTSSVTRGEARAIEQALIVRNPQFENIINSISPSHSYYQQAVNWGEAWLTASGL